MRRTKLNVQPARKRGRLGIEDLDSGCFFPVEENAILALGKPLVTEPAGNCTHRSMDESWAGNEANLMEYLIRRILSNGLVPDGLSSACEVCGRQAPRVFQPICNFCFTNNIELPE